MHEPPFLGLHSSHWFGGRLLRHDRAVLRNGFKAAFASVQDRLTLAALSALAFLWVSSGAQAGSSLGDWRLAVALPFAAAMGAQNRIARSLADFVDSSPLAADALERTSRLGYGAVWHLIAFTVAFLAMPLSASDRTLLIPPAYLCGAAVPPLWNRLVRTWRRRFPAVTARFPAMPASQDVPRNTWHALAWTVARRQVGHGRIMVVVLLVASLASLLAAIVSLAGSRSIAVAVFALAALAILAWSSRVDHAVVRFAGLAGHGAVASLGAHVAAPALAGFVLIAPAMAIGGARLATLVAASAVGAAAIVALRVFAYRLYPKRHANMMLTLLGVAAALAASAVPLLSLLLLAGATGTLWARARRVTWLTT